MMTDSDKLSLPKFNLVNKKADGGAIYKSANGDTLVQDKKGYKQYWMADGRYLYSPSLMNLGGYVNYDGKGNSESGDGKGNWVKKYADGSSISHAADGRYVKKGGGTAEARDGKKHVFYGDYLLI